VAVAQPSCQCRVANARSLCRNTTLPTARQENAGKSLRRHIVKQKIQYALPHICRHYLAFADTLASENVWDSFENGMLKLKQKQASCPKIALAIFETFAHPPP